MVPAFLISGFPRSTIISVSCLLIVSILLLAFKVYNNDRAALVPFIQLLPRYAIFYPWVFATAIFAETSLVGFSISLVVLVVSTKYVEKFWGYKEVIKFIFLNGILTNLITVIMVIIINVLGENVHGMNQPLGGGISYYMGFLVVLKQVIPEHNVVLFQGLVNFRVKHFPFILLVFAFTWSVVFQTFYPILPATFAFVVSYNYLRFFQNFYADTLLPTTNPAAGGSRDTSIIRGDASDAFQLVEFFPGVTKPVLVPVINGIYDISVLLSLIAPFDEDAIEQSNLRVQTMNQKVESMSKSSDSEADRRRQVALQVIESRVNQQ